MQISEGRFLRPVKADTRYKDADMGTEAQKYYTEFFPDSIKCERGDTLFTPIALLENIYDIRNKINKDGEIKLKQYKKN